MSLFRLVALALLAALIAGFFWFDLNQLVTLENFKARQAEVAAWTGANPMAAAGTYFLAYVAIAALNIPGAAIMTLIGGALFGLAKGTLLVSFASTLGATLAFLLSRYLLREYVEQKLPGAVRKINRGIEAEGNYYLFTLRLIPAFPFWMINMAMGLTRLPAANFAWVSQLGMLPATLVYVNAGRQIAGLDSPAGILSPALIASFALLGLFPLLTRKALNVLERRKQLAAIGPFTKPAHFDTNLVVIGAGSAGLVTAYIAAAAQAKVTLIEKDRMGGDCLNTGCVPSKALIQSARIKAYIDRAPEFGLAAAETAVDFPAVMRRVQGVIAAIAPHDSVERYTKLGVDCIEGDAHITSPWTVSVNGQTIHTRSIVIATGGSPSIPPIPGLDNCDYLTSDNLWSLTDIPGRLLVLGGGAIGCELAQAFRRLGAEVTVVEMLPRLLANEDPEVSSSLEEAFREAGIDVLTGCRAQEVVCADGAITVLCEDDSGRKRIDCDRILVATGRRGNSEGLGLEALGIGTRPNGTIPVNEYLQTLHPNVLVCGDVAGPYQLTHAAAHQAWYCAMNALYGRYWRFSVDYSVMPRAVFCDPEVASVGLNEQQAKAEGIAHEVTRYGIDDLDRAIADGEAGGFVKVLTSPGSDKILGVTIVGPHAAEIISEYTLAMRAGLGLGKILGTVHIYPTLAEANKFAAGNWRKKHLSARLLSLSRWLNHRRIN